MEDILALAKQYNNEFMVEFTQMKKHSSKVYGKLRDQVAAYRQLPNLHQEIRRRKNELLASLRNKSSLSELHTMKLMETFAWMGVMLTGMNVGSILGGLILAPILNFMVTVSDAAFSAYLLLPALAFYSIYLPHETTEQNEILRRHALFTFAAIEGFLTGFVFSQKSLGTALPFAPLTPIVIAVLPHIGSTMIGHDRTKLIWSTIGGSLMLHISIGIILDLSLPYLLLAVLYAAIGFAVLQLYVNDIGNMVFAHAYQLLFVCAVIYAQALVYALFGADEKETSAIRW